MAKEKVSDDGKVSILSLLGNAANTVAEGLVDGATSIISHGSAEAAAALFTGHGYVMYGHNGQNDQGSILDSLNGKGADLSSLDAPENPAQEQDKSRGIGD